MKLAIIYDPTCPKLTETHYSRTYLDMFEAVIARFEEVQHITDSCSAQDVEADVILIYDIHSAHHIRIDGLAQHKAVKYTYFNDPYQKAVEGVYEGIDVYVCKLGPKTRTRRALKRGVDFIICPYSGLYYKHIAPYLGKDAEDMLFWFPPAPSHKRFPLRLRPLAQRYHRILANGIHWGGDGAYDFRKWAYSQPESFFIQHACKKSDTPMADKYGNLLSAYAASLALCDTRIVPKYLEIPLAGCVCFAQDQEDYRKMGFVGGRHFISVDKENFKRKAQEFLYSTKGSVNDAYFQRIAKRGQMLISNKWTAECFADALYEHAKSKGAKCQTNESISELNVNAEKQNIPYQEMMKLAR
jgi:hypothetical protein